MAMSNIKHKQGFTLVETFVAIVILTIAVIGPLSLLSKAITDGNFAKNQITAYYLAQEGLEMVVNIRDRNLIARGTGWLSGLESCMGQFCAMDFIGSILDCGEDEECYRLSQEPNKKMYLIQGGNFRGSLDPSLFYRKIKIDQVDGGDGAMVTSMVYWVHNGRTTSPFKITSFISNQ